MSETALAALSPRLRHRLAEIEALVAREGDALMVCEAGDLAPPYPRIVLINEALTRLTGYDRQVLLGETPRLLQGPETSAETRAEIRAALEARRRVHAEIVNYTKDGETYWVALDIVAVVDPDSGRLYHVAFQRDITRRKRLEVEWAEARARADRAMQGRQDFLTAFARDIRAPLASIAAHLELLDRGGPKPAQGPLLAAAGRAAAEAGRLVDDLLDLGRIDAGATLPAPLGSFALDDFLADIRLLFASDANGLGLHFEIAAGPGLPAQMTADLTHLRQLAGVLLGCALHRTESGGVAFSVEALAGALRFSVHASGEPGHPLGLGLTVAEKLAATLGTGIVTDSAPGEGTSRWFDLPARGLAAEAAAPRPPSDWWPALRAGALVGTPPAPAPALAEVLQQRILVACADAAERATLARQLQSLGVRIDIVANGAQALILATAETPYDLVLADARLPVVDGADFIRGLRTHEAAHGLPPAQVVGLADTAAEGEALRRAGMDQALERPVGLGQLSDLLAGGSPPAPDDQPPLDAEALKQRLGIADDLELAAVLAVFAETLDGLEAGLVAAIGEADSDRAQDLLHALAAEAQDVEARALVAALAPCRIAVGNGDWPFARRTLERITAEAARLRAAMDRILGLA
ncbi:PAS domain S-box protein [Zavarzinia compransoris]|nr:PAS domain S-box protein [Zavarzinia compransoris]TDP48896.1 PAS domain S-box-containing protein [Zavarzinia compransoris]